MFFNPFLKLSRVPEFPNSSLFWWKLHLLVVWLQCFVVTLTASDWNISVVQSFDLLRIAQEVMKEDRLFVKQYVVHKTVAIHGTWVVKSRRRFQTYLAVKSTSLHFGSCWVCLGTVKTAFLKVFFENTLAQDQRLQEAQGPKMEGPIFSTMWGTQLLCCGRGMEAMIFDLKMFFCLFFHQESMLIMLYIWRLQMKDSTQRELTNLLTVQPSNLSWVANHKVSCFQLKRAMNKQHPKWWNIHKNPQLMGNRLRLCHFVVCTGCHGACAPKGGFSSQETKETSFSVLK